MTETEVLREERNQFLEQRDRYAQIACTLADVVRRLDSAGVDPNLWHKSQLAIKWIDAAIGAGERYEWPR